MVLVKSLPLFCSRSSTVDIHCESDVETLKEEIYRLTNLPEDSFLLYRGLKRLEDTDRIKDGDVVHVHCTLNGGKGGFGSMLRAIGAQIEKTTNKEACRDLSGRRLRDINEEQRLKKWIAKQAEREKEREERKRLRIQRLQEQPKHNFHDPEHDKVISSLGSKIDEALAEGLKRAETGESTSKRKIVGEPATAPAKKLKGWADDEDEDLDDLSSSDSEKEDDDSSSAPSTLAVTPDESSCGDNSRDVDSSNSSSLPSCSKTSKTKIPENKKITEPCHLDLAPFNSVEDLRELGLDRLKAALMDRGLKCGGTLQERAERLFKEKDEEKTSS